MMVSIINPSLSLQAHLFGINLYKNLFDAKLHYYLSFVKYSKIVSEGPYVLTCVIFVP